MPFRLSKEDLVGFENDADRTIGQQANVMLIEADQERVCGDIGVKILAASHRVELFAGLTRSTPDRRVVSVLFALFRGNVLRWRPIPLRDRRTASGLGCGFLSGHISE